jgi:hypothetical protein
MYLDPPDRWREKPPILFPLLRQVPSLAIPKNLHLL